MFHWILLSRLKCIILLKSKHSILFISGNSFEICQHVLTTNSASFYFPYVIHLNLLILTKVSLFSLYRWIDLTDNRHRKQKPATSAAELPVFWRVVLLCAPRQRPVLSSIPILHPYFILPSAGETVEEENGVPLRTKQHQYRHCTASSLVTVVPDRIKLSRVYALISLLIVSKGPESDTGGTNYQTQWVSEWRGGDRERKSNSKRIEQTAVTSAVLVMADAT